LHNNKPEGGLHKALHTLAALLVQAFNTALQVRLQLATLRVSLDTEYWNHYWSPQIPGALDAYRVKGCVPVVYWNRYAGMPATGSGMLIAMCPSIHTVQQSISKQSSARPINSCCVT
jgi:hypothetical protein